MGKQMLLSEEFQVGRTNAREEAVRVREIEMARVVREEKARRRALRRTARKVMARPVDSGEQAVPVAPVEPVAPVVSAPQTERRELQNVGR
jgi:hypothetical protein